MIIRGFHADIDSLRKLRKQMELKLEETLVKNEKQKKDLEGLNRAQTEHIEKLKAGNKNVIFLHVPLSLGLSNLLLQQDVYKTSCITPTPTSPPRSFVPSTSNPFGTHPILSSRSSDTAPDRANSSTHQVKPSTVTVPGTQTHPEQDLTQRSERKFPSGAEIILHIYQTVSIQSYFHLLIVDTCNAFRSSPPGSRH